MPSIEPSAAVSTLDDRELLSRVARQDRDAYEVLFERYKNKGYTLALYITGNATAAEEALQEAMIKVWSRASTFNGAGSAEGWILRIVARDASHTFRKDKRRKSERMIDEAQPAENVPPPKRVAETELILLLRNALAALTTPERELIALRFAAGLSQQEISRELKVPQQTISYRIEAILKRLRGLLPKGEQLFAAAPLAELLREAVLSGPAHPALPCPDVSKVPRYSSRHSQRVPRNAASHAWAPIAAGVGAVTLATVLIVQQNSAPKALAVTPPPVTTAAPAPVSPQPAGVAKTPPSAAPAPVIADDSFAYRWTFEKMPGDLVPFGELSCDTKTKELVFGKAAVVAFPFRARKAPVLVRYSGVTTDSAMGSKFGVNVMSNTPNVSWDKLVVAAAKGIWAQTIPNGGGKLEFASYLFGDRLVDTANGYVCRVVKFEQPCDGNPLILLNTHCRITWIEAKTIELRDIPEKYRTDIETLTRGMTPQSLEFYAPGK